MKFCSCRFFAVLVLLPLMLVLQKPCFADPSVIHITDPSGKPVVGASVDVFSLENPNTPTILVTDSSGTVIVDNGATQSKVGPGKLCMVQAKGFAASGCYVMAGSNALQLPLPETITGTVVDSKGHPVPGVAVSAQYAFTSLPTSNHPPSQFSYFQIGPFLQKYTAISDKNGDYSIDNLPLGSIVYLGTNDARYVSAQIATTKGGLTVPPIIVQPGTSISGRVLRKGGIAAPGMQVEAVGTINNVRSWHMPVVTAADGSYKVVGILPGDYSIHVSSPSVNSGSDEWLPPGPVDVTATLDKPGVAPDIVLVQGAIVKGTVVDAVTNQPIAGVQIGIQSVTSTPDVPDNVNVFTDSHGGFTTRAWPGKDSLYVYTVPLDYTNGAYQKNFDVIEGQTLTLDPIGLKKALTVSGTVVDDTGKPVVGVTVTPQYGPDEMNMDSLPPGKTDAQGAFTLHQLRPGSYYVDLGVDWFVVSPLTFVLPSTGPISIVVKKNPTATLDGTVVDSTGAPIADVSVSMIFYHPVSNTNAGSYVTTTTDSSGKFEFADAPLATGLIAHGSFTKDGFVFDSGGDISATNGQLSITPIVLAQVGGQVSGTVRNGLGAAVPGAWVLCPDAAGTLMPTQADDSGRFTLSNLMVGPVDLYAAKGGYYGTTAANAELPTAGATQDTAISLGPIPASPTPEGLDAATRMLQRIYIDYHTSAHDSSGDWWQLSNCAAQIATVDPKAAVGFIGRFNEPDGGCLQWIIPAQATIDPANEARWGIPMLERFGHDGHQGKNAVDLGLVVAPYDIKSASTLYDIAIKNVRLDQFTENSIGDAMELSALAYAVGRSDADTTYQIVSEGMDRLVKDAKPGDPNADWLPANFAKEMAHGNLPIALQKLATLSRQERFETTIEIVTDLARFNPKGAMAVFHTLDSQKDEPNISWPYDACIGVILPDIFASDPKEALRLAKSVDDPASRAEALVTVADLLPLTQAEPLYREAETASEDNSGMGSTPASVAAHALLRDDGLGRDLFKEAFNKVIVGAASNPNSQAMYSEFAFYYARIDPGFSRLLLENQFKTDLRRKSLSGYPGDCLTADVAAMAAIDIDRAKELASSIGDPDARFTAGLRIAQYVLLTPKERNTLGFESWMSDYGRTINPYGPW